MSVYWQGLTMGLAYVAPIGMQNLFVINSAMHQKGWRAIRMALIVIFFDISLGLACFLGVGALMNALPWLKQIILAVGSAIVIWIGVGLIRSKAELKDVEVEMPVWKIFTTAFVVTWLNPQALIDGTMMLGAFRATLPAGTDAFFIGGFCSASFVWFNALAIAVSLLASRVNEKVLTWINRICGAVIVFYGLKLLWSFISEFIK